MWRPGSAPSDDAHQARYLLQQLGLKATRTPAGCRAARRAARRWRMCWRRSRTSCCSTSRPTTSTCRPSNGWRQTLAAQRGALVIISHDRRFLETLSRSDGVARPRTGAARRGGLQAVRGLARRAAGRGRGAAAQARPQDRARGALGPLRRDRRGASATCGAWRSCANCARRGASIGGATGKAVIEAAQAEKSGTLVIEAKGIAKAFGARADRRQTSPPA